MKDRERRGIHFYCLVHMLGGMGRYVRAEAAMWRETRPERCNQTVSLKFRSGPIKIAYLDRKRPEKYREIRSDRVARLKMKI